MFTATEIETLQDALDMAIASNKRMQNSKPKFKAVFDKIEQELVELKIKVSTAATIKQK